jgi:branched-chain amino acid transport system substrate-binding protein
MKFSLSKLPVLAALILATACTMPLKNPLSTAERKPMQQQGVVAAENPAITRGAIAPNTPSVKVALLVPLSGDSVAVGNAMMDAALMALNDSYLTVPSGQIRSQVILIPKDTGASTVETELAAQTAIEQGAQFIIGPLFSQSVRGVAGRAQPHNVNVLSFSNNKAVAGNGAYVFGFLPEQQVERIAEYAYLNRLERIAVLAPNDVFGQKVRELLAQNYAKKGGTVAPTELYAPSPVNIEAAVSRLVNAYNNTPEERRFQAIFIADGGYQMKRIIDGFRKHSFDLSKVKLLGTGLWDDPEIAAMPELNGAWFPSSPPEAYKTFESHFMAVYGYKPVRLASLAYDAVTLVANLTMAGTGEGVNAAALVDPRGYNGPANGLYRLNMDGTSERKLAILEITPQGFKVIEPAATAFNNPTTPLHPIPNP